MIIKSLSQVSDRELLDAIACAAADERLATVELIELLGEVDSRRLYLPEGCSSLFTYCTQVLRFSEQEAYHRIEAARAARSFPVLLDRLRDGALTVTAITVLRPHLTAENADLLIAAAIHKSKREVEHQMACIAPKPDARSILRRLPDAKPDIFAHTTIPAGPSPVAPSSVPVVVPQPAPILKPVSADRYLLRVTLTADAHDKLRRAQDLLRHTSRSGDPAVIIERALELLIQDLERQRMARVQKPRSPNGDGDPVASRRYVPAAVRRAVWNRDGGRCAFAGAHGRCRETGRLEFHHVQPFAFGGPTTAENLELRCRAHNQYEGQLIFGDPPPARERDL